MRKKIYLFLDDVRIPDPQLPWNVVRSYEAAVEFVLNNGCPDVISFDHDLGEGKSGYDFAKWLVEMDLDKKIEIPLHFSYVVHSANPVGRENIIGLLESYMQKSKSGDCFGKT